MNIDDFDTVNAPPVLMPVKSPKDGTPLVTEDGTPVTIRLVGVDSAQYQVVLDAQVNRAIKTRGPKTVEDMRRDDLDLLVACTLGWTGISDSNGPLQFTPANALGLYQRLPFLRDQVKEFINDRANFLNASAKA